MSISITEVNGRLRLVAPYTPELPPRAKALGGRFDGTDKAWVFDPRDVARVRALAREIYGTDGSAPAAVVTVRVNVNRVRSEDGALFMFGRSIARRPSRDEAVRLGPGVILIAGGFPHRGGSVRNPALAASPETVVEVRDVPASHPELIEYQHLLEIVQDQPQNVLTPDEEAAVQAMREILGAIAPERRQLIMAHLG